MSVALTSLDKVLWPLAGFTKGQMLDYYRAVAPVLLPHLAGRALTLGRFPDGVDGTGFAQTECRGRPEWMRTLPLRLKSGDVRNYCLVEDLRSLMWVANLGTIELHTFLARGREQDRPTVVAFDLDPGPGTGLADCCRLGLRLRDELAARGLAAFAKTSGGAGIHVYVPLNTPHTYDQTRGFAAAVATRLAVEDPNRVTAGTRRRAGRVLIDWLQNHERRSTVAPYSLRATDLPGVSTPLAWEELEQGEDLRFSPAEVLDRIERLGDLFQPVMELRQTLPGGG